MARNRYKVTNMVKDDNLSFVTNDLLALLVKLREPTENYVYWKNNLFPNSKNDKMILRHSYLYELDTTIKTQYNFTKRQKT